jgi:TetR/AcrR family transcriptional repressor of nem operon
MRRSREEKAETRAKIITTAARAFRRDGIAETSLAKFMPEAGLTHGGFYRHFDSKDQLVAEACEAALDQMISAMEAQASNKEPLEAKEAIVSKYLSPKHRDQPEIGCPLSAIGSELRRCDQATRQIASNGIKRIVSLLADQMKDLSPQAARAQATSTLATMVGGLILSRILDDQKVSSRMLRDTRNSLVEDE